MNDIDEYFKTRHGGVWYNNPWREDFIHKHSEFNEAEFENFIKANELIIPESYVEYLRNYNGNESDKTVTFSVSSPTVTSTIPLILSFERAKAIYMEIQRIRTLQKNFFPVALVPRKNAGFYLKAGGENQGYIYNYDDITDELYLCCLSIDEFFRLLGTDI